MASFAFSVLNVFVPSTVDGAGPCMFEDAPRRVEI